MLKHRLLTALVLIPLVLGGIFALPTQYFALALGLFVFVGALEWAALIGIESFVARIVYSVLVIVLLMPAYDLLGGNDVVWIWLIALAWWTVSFSTVRRYRGETGIVSRNVPYHALVGLIILVPTWVALVFLHEQFDEGPWLVLFVMALIWVADSGAYFVGRKWGKRKLAPLVSPGKTIEGATGALIATSIYAAIGLYQLGYRGDELAMLTVLCAVIVVYSILGDLVESMYKRRAGVKDSGSIFPGHGGVLDRIDSITAAAPLFALAYWWLEYGW